MSSRLAITRHLDALLAVGQYKDYGPNGLQVEGRLEIGHMVCGVTASLALIDAAIEARADAVLVHHGLFWRGHDGRVTGWMKQRLARLLAHDISLFAYHLPLDGHAELGNNAQLGRVLGLVADGGDVAALRRGRCRRHAPGRARAGAELARGEPEQPR